MLSRLVIAAAIIDLVGCRPRVNMEAERAALLQTDRDWSALAHAGSDTNRIVDYWSDDARVYPPDMAVIDGKAAIRNFVAAMLRTPGFSITWEPREAVVSPDGQLGYTTGVNSFTVPGAQGKLMTIAGKYVTVWRKGPDGTWHCVIDFWNSTLAAARAS